MAFQRTLTGGLIALCVSALAAHAQSDVFDLTVAGIPLATVTLRAESSDGAYTAFSSIAPNGFVGAFTDYAYSGRATGRMDASGKLKPVRFESDSTSPRATRRTEIDWVNGAPVNVSVVPPRRSQVDPLRGSGALDPVSAGFALLRENDPGKVCDTEVEVFDGSRRSRLALGKPVADGQMVVCSGSYSRLEGEAHTLSNQSEYPFRLTFSPNGAGKVRLERIETKTRFGVAVVSRRG